MLARFRFGEVRLLFRSAGFLTGGRPPPQLLVEALAEHGVNAGGHRSYRLDEASLRAADVVLTMESEHVRQAATILPSAFPKIMPIRQAAAVLDDIDGETVPMSHLVAALNVDRDPAQYLGRRWEVDDPYGGRLRDYRRAVAQIDDLLTSVIERLL